MKYVWCYFLNKILLKTNPIPNPNLNYRGLEPVIFAWISVFYTVPQRHLPAIQWTVSLSSTTTLFNRLSLDYTKADFPAIRRALNAIDWSATLKGDVTEQWVTFASIIKRLESQHIPLKKSNRHKKGSVDDVQSGEACRQETQAVQEI